MINLNHFSGYFAICIILLMNHQIAAQPAFPLSTNVYRAPYANGTEFFVSNDVFTHSPVGRYDLIAQGDDDCSTHVVVAAADGIVRMVMDTNTTSCSSGCGQFNNYVWLQHDNGEWTKYTHMATNSVPVDSGDVVQAGDPLGFECWVGNTNPPFGRHLHFEVRKPDDPENPPIDPSGGFLNSSDGGHLVPVLCGTPGQFVMNDGDMITAGSCGNCIVQGDISLSNETWFANEYRVRMTDGLVSASTVVFFAAASGLLQSEQRVTLTPGFRATPGSAVMIRIGPCQTN